MIWLSWRQQRTEALITVGLLALLGGVVVPEALHLASLYSHDAVARCVDHKTPACQQTLADFGGHAGILRSVMPWFTLLPGVIGVALAAPVMLDLESGTFRLAWTQSITRKRWIASRFSIAVVTALAAAGVLALLFTWYRTPLDRVYGRFDGSSGSDVEGHGGARLRPLRPRTRPSRRRRLAPNGTRGRGRLRRVRRLAPLRRRLAATTLRDSPQRDVELQHTRAEPRSFLGVVVGTERSSRSPVQRRFRRRPVVRADRGQWHQRPRSGLHGPPRRRLQPRSLAARESRFWEFQGIETALFGGVALVLLAFAAWWLRERSA